MEQKGWGLRLFDLRWRRLRLTQREFADRFGFSFGVIKDCEQMRGTPSRAARVLVEAIALDPELVARAAANVRERQAEAGNPLYPYSVK